MLEESLLPNLREVHYLISEMMRGNVDFSGSVPTLKNGRKGRPKLEIKKEWLEYLLSKGFKGSDIGKMLRVSDKTVYRRLQEFGIPVRGTYSSIGEAELDSIVRGVLHDFPNCGYKAMQGHLMSKGYKIQEDRTREAMRRVDPVGKVQTLLIFNNFSSYPASPSRILVKIGYG